MRLKEEKGVVLVGVILLMVLMSIMIPAMVYWVQNETRWTVKQDRSIRAYQLAEAAIDRAFNKVTESTATWNALQLGGDMSGTGIPTSYIFNMTYTDLSSGTYTIAVSSGPDTQQVTIIAVGRDFDKKETRAIKAIYQNSPLGDIAIMGGNGVDVTGNNMEVEWGAIVSPKAIETGGKLHPTFWSASSIDLDVNGSTPPNCDSPSCHFWHSYYSGIPPVPDLDFDAYKALAQAAGTGPCGDYYTDGNMSLDGCNDSAGKTYYITGNVTDMSGHIQGNIITIGNFSTSNGALGGGAVTATLPREAWKQYANNWPGYLVGWDPTRPASFPGVSSSYKSPANATVAINPVLSGFLYVGGNFQGPNGGGNSEFVHGVIYVKGIVSLNTNSHLKNYYSSNAASSVMATKIYLKRQSWQELVRTWPSSAGP